VNGQFTNAFVIPYPPFFQANLQIEKYQKGKNFANFVIAELIPGSKYKLRVKYSGEITPEFIFKAEQSGHPNPPFYFKESSLITLIAKNEFGIIFGIILFWTILIILYMYNLKQNSNESRPPNNNDTNVIGWFFWSKEKQQESNQNN
jgi:hypothetical protein